MADEGWARVAGGVSAADGVGVRGGRWGWSRDDWGGASLSFGTRENSGYRYLSAYQGFRLTDRLALQANASWMRLDTPDVPTSLRLLTLTGTYDLDSEHTVSMRLVDAAEGFNAYLAYSQKVRRGTDLYVILGDPNADETTERLAVKTVSSF